MSACGNSDFFSTFKGWKNPTWNRKIIEWFTDNLCQMSGGTGLAYKAPPHTMCIVSSPCSSNSPASSDSASANQLNASGCLAMTMIFKIAASLFSSCLFTRAPWCEETGRQAVMSWWWAQANDVTMLVNLFLLQDWRLILCLLWTGIVQTHGLSFLVQAPGFSNVSNRSRPITKLMSVRSVKVASYSQGKRKGPLTLFTLR